MERLVQRSAKVGASTAVEATDTAAPAGRQTLVQDAAARGVAAGGRRMPYFAEIQKAFGRHDVSGVSAHIGGETALAAKQIGAHAYATGERVAFVREPDLFMAAHEAAHVVQQRGGVTLAGGIDAGAGDAHEQHANEVAKRVVAGQSAEDLLDRYGAAGGTAKAGSVQRIGNDTPIAEHNAIDAIVAGQPTPLARAQALVASNAAEVTYGLAPGTDEEAEITASGSYLQRKKTDWRAELQNRNNGNPANWQSWETFQYEMDRAAPAMQRNQPPWFMQAGAGYAVTGHRVNNMQAVNNNRNDGNLNADDPQRLLGLSYQRDTMYTLGGADINRHQGAVNNATPAATIAGWANDVLTISHAGGPHVRMRITGAVQVGANAHVTGTTVAGAHNAGGIAVGTAVRLEIDQVANTIAVHQVGGAPLGVIPVGWNGELQSWAYYQSRVRMNEAVGAEHGGNGAQARNRGAAAPLDDAMHDTIANRYNNGGDRSTRNTLGPQRTRLNFHDAEVGWDLEVAPYRRMGGDAIFQEAAHPMPGAYQNQLQPANGVNVTNPNWYYNQQNSMPNRFVGGRSNSTGLYMSSATMLFHQGRLTLADAKDVLAFVIADMVVSGEHSMVECMTTVVQAAGHAEPWTATPLNLAGALPTLRVWRELVPAATLQAMLNAAQASLLQLCANPNPDRKLVKVMTLLIKALLAP